MPWVFCGGKQCSQTQGLLVLDLLWVSSLLVWPGICGAALLVWQCLATLAAEFGPSPCQVLAHRLQLDRQQERCPQDFVWEDMPSAHPHPTACRGMGQLHPGHFCIQASGGKSMDILFPLTYSSAAGFFPSILSLSLPGWLNELFSLLPALTFLCARPWAAGHRWREEWAGRGCPCRKAGVGCARHGKRLGAGELPALGSFSSLN